MATWAKLIRLFKQYSIVGKTGVGRGLTKVFLHFVQGLQNVRFALEVILQESDAHCLLNEYILYFHIPWSLFKSVRCNYRCNWNALSYYACIEHYSSKAFITWSSPSMSIYLDQLGGHYRLCYHYHGYQIVSGPYYAPLSTWQPPGETRRTSRTWEEYYGEMVLRLKIRLQRGILNWSCTLIVFASRKFSCKRRGSSQWNLHATDAIHLRSEDSKHLVHFFCLNLFSSSFIMHSW